MGQIRVMVVDDCDLSRELIVAILSTDKDILVIGEAKDGREAVEKVRTLKPDIVTMDIEMPVMNGLDAIGHIMATNAVPILVVTILEDANIAYTAISRGALDLMVKPDVSHKAAREFIQKIKLLSKIKVITHINRNHGIQEAVPLRPPLFSGTASDRVVAIASSTGGPQALSIILSELPASFPCPIVIAQHDPDGFIPGLVEWLDRITTINVKVAEEGKMILPGTAYISPTEQHMEITIAGRVIFRERQPQDVYHPSCDILLSSVAQAYNSRGIGIILTGMGSDGVLGMKQIKEMGGMTIAQDEASCIVYGMPKVAIDSGCINKIVPLHKISREIMNLVGASAAEKKSVV